jgi:hypothetical protein
MTLIVAVLTIVAAACSDDAVETSTTSETSTSTTTVETTTTAVDATTTAVDATTTTAPPETTTTTVAESTTTTEATVALKLSDEGIQAGITWIPFGTIDEETIAAVTAVLGAPTNDSGWIDSFLEYGVCPEPVVRGVHWDSFVVLFTQAETDFWSSGVPHFFSWYYTAVPPEIETTEGLVIGDSLATLETLYGGPKLEIDEDPFDPSGGIWLYDTETWTGLWGFADGQDPGSVISAINGGHGCGE